MSGAARNPWIVKAPILGIASNPAGAEQQLPPLPGGGEAPAAANPRLSLFCFTPAGSGACVYHGWEHHLPEVVEVGEALLTLMWLTGWQRHLVAAAKSHHSA